MKQLLILMLISSLSFGQNKLNIRTQTQIPAGTGIGFIRFNATAIDSAKSPGAGMSIKSNGSNTGWEWYVPSTGTGTVTSVASGLGITGGTITTSGTLAVDTSDASILSRQRAANTYATIGSVALKVNISDTASMLSPYLKSITAAATYAPISITGTVTSVATGFGLSGGTITGSGTLLVDSSTVCTVYNMQDNNDNDILAHRSLGSTIIAQCVGCQTYNINSSGLAQTAARLYFHAVYIPVAKTITGLKFYVITGSNAIEGTGTSSCAIALYSYSGGTLTLVDSSARDTALFDTGTAWKTKAFAFTYNASPGIYFAAFIWNRTSATTAPTLGTLPTTQGPIMTFDYTNSAMLFGIKSSVTNLPTSQAISGLTKTTSPYYVAIY